LKGERPVAIGVGAFFLVLLPMVLVAGAVREGAGPRLCVSCHAGSVIGAQAKAEGPHARVACGSCHRDARLIRDALVGKRSGGPRAIPVAAAGPAIKASSPPQDVPEEACLGCHQKVLEDQPKEGAKIKAAHGLHASKGIRCFGCHRETIHGRLSADGKKVEYPRPAETTCLNCHRKLLKPGSWPVTLVRCPTCHVMNLRPPFHDATWYPYPTRHGPAALGEGPSPMPVAICAGCHGNQRIDWCIRDPKEDSTYETPEEAEELKKKGVKCLDDTQDARTFARNNFWCQGCHINNRPPRHSDIWRVIHKTQALPSTPYCLVCHNSTPPDITKGSLEERAQPQYWCARCHDARVKHPPKEEWVPVHFQYVKSQGVVEGACFNCHARSHCLVCHQSAGAKTWLDWFKQKGASP